MNENNPTPYQKNRNGRFWTGVVFLAIGGLLFADKIGFDIPHWIFTWQMLLIVIGAIQGIKNDFKGSSWLILIAIGSIFLWDEFWIDFHLKKFLFPFLFIAIGLIYILRPKSNWRMRKEFERKNWKVNHEFVHETDFTEMGEDYFEANSVFSGVKRTILSKNFKGGKIACVFGGAEIDFTQADIQGTAILRIEEVFGGAKLIVPSNWTVRNELEGVFHGFDDKRNNYSQAQTDMNKTLVIKGSAVFAGVEVRSF